MTEIRIEASKRYAGIRRRLRDTERGMAAAIRRPWHLAGESFFDETQRRVHVLSGRLKTSGEHNLRVERDRVVSEVRYGGKIIDARVPSDPSKRKVQTRDGKTYYIQPGPRPVDYAEYEARRGGTHDYLDEAWDRSRDRFEHAVGVAFDRVWANIMEG